MHLCMTGMSQGVTPVLVRGDSSLRVFMGGSLKTLASYSPKRTLPGHAANFVLLPKDPTGVESSFDLTARASTLYLAADGPKVGNFKLGGKVVVYLTKDVSSPAYGILPAMMLMEASNDKWRFAAGQQVDVFAPRIPGLIDGFFALAASGCAGNSSRGQLRAEHYAKIGETGKLTVTAALSQPVSTYFSSDLRNNTTNKGVPNLEWALNYTLDGQGDSWVPWGALEVGVSGVMGSYRVFRNDTVNGVITNVGINTPKVRGYAADVAVRLGKRFGIQAEAYTGQALGNYLGGILQTTKGPKDREIRSSGWWMEAAYYWSANVHSRFGYGQDACRREDLMGAGILKNSTVFGNLTWEANRWLTLGFEMTHKDTRYLPTGRDNKGMTYMGMVQFSF
jgi:hypothetical protein